MIADAVCFQRVARVRRAARRCGGVTLPRRGGANMQAVRATSANLTEVPWDRSISRRCDAKARLTDQRCPTIRQIDPRAGDIPGVASPQRGVCDPACHSVASRRRPAARQGVGERSRWDLVPTRATLRTFRTHAIVTPDPRSPCGDPDMPAAGQGLRTTRKPMSNAVPLSENSTRLEALRSSSPNGFHDSPRMTHDEPVAGPGGLTPGLAA